MRKIRLDDYCAMETDVLLTAILYERINASTVKLNALDARIKYLRNKILKK